MSENREYPPELRVQSIYKGDTPYRNLGENVMTMKIRRKRGKDYIVIDTRPSKQIRKVKAKIERRQREIYTHFRSIEKVKKK
jgi:hypothetical protein